MKELRYTFERLKQLRTSRLYKNQLELSLLVCVQSTVKSHSAFCIVPTDSNCTVHCTNTPITVSLRNVHYTHTNNSLTMHCARYTPQKQSRSALFTVHPHITDSLCTVHCSLYTNTPITVSPCTVHCTLTNNRLTLHCALYTKTNNSFTLHCALYNPQ